MGVLWSYQHSTTDVLGTSYPALRHRKVSETGSILAIYESSKVICFSFNYLHVTKCLQLPLTSFVKFFSFPHLSVISSSVWGQSNAVLFKNQGFFFFGISLDQWIPIFMDAEMAKHFSNAYIWNPPSNRYSAAPLQRLCQLCQEAEKLYFLQDSISSSISQQIKNSRGNLHIFLKTFALQT